MKIAILSIGTLVLFTLLAAPTPGAGQERKLVVGTVHAPPFAMRDEAGQWVGISIDLWRAVARDLGLAFEFRELELSQLLAGLQSGSLDVVVAALTVTADREESFDFSHPFYSSGLAVAVLDQPQLGVLSLLSRFASTALLRALAVLIGAIWVAGALVWLFERRRNPEQFGGGLLRGMGEAFWWSAVTMTTVGYGDRTPKTLGGRAFALIWMFTGIVIISVLTAAITSALTIGNLQTDIRGLDDLRRGTVAAVAGTTSQAWLERNGVRRQEFATARASLEAVASGEIKSAVHDAPILRYLAVNEYKGRIRVLPQLFDPQTYALGLQEQSTLREPVNRALLRQVDSASWTDIVRRYVGEGG